jgi:lysylphosphatidylglycerol synthetase-like protein (DUF2156 family)
MKAIRIVAIVLVGLTAVVNLLGGAGTYCAAFTPDKFDSMKALIPLQWLYQLFVVTVVAAGAAGVWTTFTLARVRKNSYRAALIVVAAGLVLAVVQMAASRALRGKSMPTDLRLYVSVITLLALLILRLPGVWQKAGMDSASGGGGSWTAPTGTAAIVMGLAVLTVPTWVGQSHVCLGLAIDAGGGNAVGGRRGSGRKPVFAAQGAFTGGDNRPLESASRLRPNAWRTPE